MSAPQKRQRFLPIRRTTGDKSLLADQRGDVLVGFVLIVGLLFSLFFAGVGFFLLLSWLQFTEMATQAGVRTAVVRSPAVAGLPAVNGPANGGLLGQSCTRVPSPCAPLTTSSCGPLFEEDVLCSGTAFDHIFERMRQFFPDIPLFTVVQPGNISIRYEDSGLGYVGGPPVPLVTVAVSGVEIPVIGAIIDLAFRLVGGAAGDNATMRPIQASMTAEDLNTAGSP
jgi:hypothetical protein